MRGSNNLTTGLRFLHMHSVIRPIGTAGCRQISLNPRIRGCENGLRGRLASILLPPPLVKKFPSPARDGRTTIFVRHSRAGPFFSTQRYSVFVLTPRCSVCIQTSWFVPSVFGFPLASCVVRQPRRSVLTFRDPPVVQEAVCLSQEERGRPRSCSRTPRPRCRTARTRSVVDIEYCLQYPVARPIAWFCLRVQQHHLGRPPIHEPLRSPGGPRGRIIHARSSRSQSRTPTTGRTQG
ncbi:hypothetical protein QBC33DRAFT_542984 [Phialemonium atrogriseum]|uniref:Uncharacterized protein n=1 Tax=Phialemonium atrogriseum TaxID=1093897 RepID=A0AAJ0BZF6_9PEZI|nr:uncharacterized protein QBC33DRAFT_542984 [Phialemonium atrogriseum]KAK1765949.1 hypothetical protein QBC33DRAFT_542984 [Phialemonium atrogriseum]